MTFQDLGIDQDIVDALANKGIVDPFPIQEQAIPVALSGQDIIGQAKTGTGKTFGFGLPLIQRLGKSPTKGAKALVVVPTRELAQQVFEDLVLATQNRETTVAVIIGGKVADKQIKDIEQGAQIIVGTPGRLVDLNNQRKLDLSKIEIMVLDEADEMLDLGFLPDIEKLFAKTPSERQTLLFSATMPGPIVNLARKYQNRAVHIRVNDPDEGHTKADIKQFVYRAHSLDKDEMVGRILQSPQRGKTVIFVKTKRTAAKLGEELVDRGFNATALHGDMNQDAREKSMKAFRDGKKEILVATEVAARGIDVDDVTHVINYSCPEDEKAYLHRIGRTGRAGRTGIAITLVDWEDMVRWQHINKELQLDYHDPVETYSSSKNLFEDLSIAEGTKGRLKATSPKATEQKPTSQHQRSDRNKTRSGDKPHKTNTEHRNKDEHDKHQTHEHRTPNSERTRQRRRTRGGA